MSDEFDQILISSSQPDFVDRLTKIRAGVFEATHFNYGSDEDEQLDAILDEVSRRGDAAIAEFTERFDGVKLSPEQFRVSKEDLAKAHNEIDPQLLKSIRQAIGNVKKYQTEIFIGNKKYSSRNKIYAHKKGWDMCARSVSSIAFHSNNDSRSSAGRRCEGNCSGFAAKV